MSSRPLAIVTGANNGFGYEAASLLLARGTDVVLACRSATRAVEAVAALSRTHSGPACGTPTFMSLDLADLASVAAFATAFLALQRPLSLLILNAGIACLGAREETAQGFEATVGTNHLGHAALFNLLLPHLQASRTRVVAVGSMVHTGGRCAPGTPLDADTGIAAYKNSKLLNTVWALEVQRRHGAGGVTANSVHPGAGLYTGLGPKGALAWLLRATLVPLLTPLLWLVGFSQTWREGGVAELAAADAAQGGLYFHRHWEAQASAAARDAATGAWVWAETQRLLREAAAKHGLPAAIAAPV